MNKTSITGLLGAAVMALFASSQAAAISITLGTQDFVDGSFLFARDYIETSQGEPPPFSQYGGADTEDSFSEKWTFKYTAGGIDAASIMFGIYDHDSAASGKQVKHFSVDGVDLTAALNNLFQSSGGEQMEYNVYELVLPDSALSVLADGKAKFSLSLEGNGLLGAPGTSSTMTAHNGAGLDFSTLNITPGSPIPVPASIWLFGSGILGLVGIARRRRLA